MVPIMFIIGKRSRDERATIRHNRSRARTTTARTTVTTAGNGSDRDGNEALTRRVSTLMPALALTYAHRRTVRDAHAYARRANDELRGAAMFALLLHIPGAQLVNAHTGEVGQLLAAVVEAVIGIEG